ncbi:MAG: RES family NAD+ phosphorylase [Betaproteobacteria bacterium]
MSSRTWTPPAVGSESTRFAGEVWRAVEAQHIASTMALVDTLDEQRVLEDLLDEGKPGVPAAARQLHYLLFTPFRYRPPRHGSRFRGDNDPGVFYAADEVRTACAELGYWRWRHLLDTPALSAMPVASQTVFRVKVAASSVDLRKPPFVADRARWTDPGDYGACQAFARAAREAAVQVIRYQSVRDPRRGGCCALLDPGGFAKRDPLEQQTWVLSVTRERVVWRRSHTLRDETFDFAADAWRVAVPRKNASARKRRVAARS